MTQRQRSALRIKPPHPNFKIKYIQLADPIPSVEVVPVLARQLMATTTDKADTWRVENGPFYGMTAVVENGKLRVVEW